MKKIIRNFLAVVWVFAFAAWLICGAALVSADVNMYAARIISSTANFLTNTARLLLPTADAADNGTLFAVAGGAAPTDGTRGAGVFLYGNENADPGKLELIAGNAAGDGRIQIITKAASAINFLTGNSQRLGISGTGVSTFTGTVLSTASSDIGWTVKNVVNTACNTTCTNACVVGQDNDAGNIMVLCTDAAADTCLCAGAS